MHFGATVSVPLPGTAYQVSALGLAAARRARSTSSSTPARASSSRRSQPGLSVRVFKKTKKVGKKTVVTWWAQALDDGFGVPGAHVPAPGAGVHGERLRQGQADGAGFKRGSGEGCGSRATSAPLSESA